MNWADEMDKPMKSQKTIGDNIGHVVVTLG